MKKHLKTLLIAMLIIPVSMLATACSSSGVVKEVIGDIKGIYDLDGTYLLKSIVMEGLFITPANLKDGTIDEGLELIRQEVNSFNQEEGEEISLQDMKKGLTEIFEHWVFNRIKIAGDIIWLMDGMMDNSEGSSVFKFTINDSISSQFFDYGVLHLVYPSIEEEEAGEMEMSVAIVMAIWRAISSAFMFKYDDGNIAVKTFYGPIVSKFNFEKQ